MFRLHLPSMYQPQTQLTQKPERRLHLLLKFLLRMQRQMQ
jgi:hypothetical protein